MAKKKVQNEVVRHDPTVITTPTTTQVIMIPDPNTGQNIPCVYDEGTRQYIPVQLPQHQQDIGQDIRGKFEDNNALGTHKRIKKRAVQRPDGSIAYEIDEDIMEVTGRTLSDAAMLQKYRDEHQAQLPPPRPSALHLPGVWKLKAVNLIWVVATILITVARMLVLDATVVFIFFGTIIVACVASIYVSKAGEENEKNTPLTILIGLCVFIWLFLATYLSAQITIIARDMGLVSG